MADDVENDDQWLYGDNTEGNPPEDQSQQTENSENKSLETPAEETPAPIEPAPINYPEDQIKDDGPPGVDEPAPGTENGEADNEREDGELKQNGDDEEDLEDDSDDDVNVVIGDIKTTTSYPQQQHSIKRGGLTTTIGDKSKQIQQTGKFQVEEFEQIGTINGVPASDYNLDALEDKPWRKPGADITDYFNYGFNEDTWKAYCERQKRIRINESGVGIMPLNAIGLPRGPVVVNDGNKYGNQNYMMQGAPRPIPAPVMKVNDAPKMNTIQIRSEEANRMIGESSTTSSSEQATHEKSRSTMPRSSVACGSFLGKLKCLYGEDLRPKCRKLEDHRMRLVMTADRREYSRKPGFPDLSVPPPMSYPEPFIPQPEYGFNPEPEPFYGGYEPTQDSQWMEGQGNPNWQPSEIKTLTGGSPPRPMGPPSIRRSPGRRSPSKDRDRDRDRDRESRSRSVRPRDHEREKSRRRERSRSRSRRHKSRSRSPSHRSHKKKKSRRHEDSD